MCDCWLIERAATPIASTGGAASSVGTTRSGSIATVHGQRGCSRGSGAPVTCTTANTRGHTEAQRTRRSARLDPRPAREAGAVQQLGPLVEPALGQGPAGVAHGLQPV